MKVVIPVDVVDLPSGRGRGSSSVVIDGFEDVQAVTLTIKKISAASGIKIVFGGLFIKDTIGMI